MNRKFKNILLLISLLMAGLLVLTSCGDLVTKVEPEETKTETEVLEEGKEKTPEEISKEPEEKPSETLEGDRYAILIDTDLSRVESDKKTPEDLRKGDVVYIYKVEDGMAYVDVIRHFGDAPLDFNKEEGYIPLENLILNPTPEDFENNSRAFHVKSGEIKGTETVTNREVTLIQTDGFYTVAEEIEEDKILIPQAGGAHSVWISKEDTDFDFSGFTGYER